MKDKDKGQRNDKEKHYTTSNNLRNRQNTKHTMKTKFDP